MLQHPRIRYFRHGLFITRNRQATFGNVERAFGGAAVIRGVVQNALLNAVARYDVGFECIAVRRQREFPRHPVAVEDNAITGQAYFFRTTIREVAVEEILNTLVGGAKVAC